jgi:hypothetical protein
MNPIKPVLPNFLIAGAAKSGTTAFYYQLKRHPEIFLSPVKEPCYLTSTFLRLPQPGIKDELKFYVRTFEDYCKLFEDAAGKKAVGEASADTLYFHEKVIPVIKRVLGNPKIIILLRDPSERAYSAYLHLVRDNREYLSFEDGLKEEDERIRRDWQCMWHYKNRGMYYRQVKAFMEAFDRVNVFIYEDFRKNSPDVIKQACEFLEVDTSYKPADSHARYNVSGVPRFKALNNIFLMKNVVQRTARKVGSAMLTEDRWTKFRDSMRAKLFVKSPMKPETRAYLQQVFHEDILRLQDLVRKDLSHWLKAEGQRVNTQ